MLGPRSCSFISFQKEVERVHAEVLRLFLDRLIFTNTIQILLPLKIS